MSDWICPECGTSYLNQAPGAICPKDEAILVEHTSWKAHPDARLLGASISNRYQVYGVLGIGGFGEVYAAFDPLENRQVAIKTIHSGVDLIAADALNRFRQEADLLKQLASPNIVQVYEIDHTEDLLYMVLEHVPGRSLKTILTDGRPLSLDRAIHITCQVLEGLAPAHKVGLIHRDLKPGNIMVDEAENDAVKLIDLGIAKVLGAKKDSVPKTGTGLVLGTVRYMAPEQLRRDGLVSTQTDLYSVGIVFYEMITGRTPYDGSPAEMAAAHLYHDPPSIPPIHHSNMLDDWFARVMCKAPDERYLDALTMRADLLQCQSSDTIMDTLSPEFLARLNAEEREFESKSSLIPSTGDAYPSPNVAESPITEEDTSDSPNDVLALLTPITDDSQSGTIEIHAPVSILENPGLTRDEIGTPSVVTIHAEPELDESTHPATARHTPLGIHPVSGENINTMTIESMGSSLADSRIEHSPFSDALSAPTERLSIEDMSSGNFETGLKDTEAQPKKKGTLSDTPEGLAQSKLEKQPRHLSEARDVLDGHWLDESTEKWIGYHPEQKRTYRNWIWLTIALVLIAAAAFYAQTAQAQGTPNIFDRTDVPRLHARSQASVDTSNDQRGKTDQGFNRLKLAREGTRVKP